MADDGSLRVGIDLRLLDRRGMERSGIGRYALEVTRNLASARPRWRLTVYSNRPRLLGDIRADVVATHWPTQATIGRVGWQHIGGLLEQGRQSDVWFSPAYVLPSWWRGRSVVTVHDLTFLLDPGRYRGRVNASYATVVTRWSARRANRVLCGARFTARAIEARLGVPRKRLAVTPYGVASRFLTCERGPREPFLLFVGVFEARKGLEVLEGALQTVRRHHPGVRLVLAGSPGWGTEAVVTRLRADPAVMLLDAPSDDVLAGLYATAAALLYPSRMEGFGLPVAEAMAVGCPVVASDLEVIREFAGTVPAYAAPGDAGALADAVRAVLDDPGQAEARARAGMAMARSLTWEATAEGTARAIEAAGADPTRDYP